MPRGIANVGGGSWSASQLTGSPETHSLIKGIICMRHSFVVDVCGGDHTTHVVTILHMHVCTCILLELQTAIVVPSSDRILRMTHAQCCRDDLIKKN